MRASDWLDDFCNARLHDLWDKMSPQGGRGKKLRVGNPVGGQTGPANSPAVANVRSVAGPALPGRMDELKVEAQRERETVEHAAPDAQAHVANIGGNGIPSLLNHIADQKVVGEAGLPAKEGV